MLMGGYDEQVSALAGGKWSSMGSFLTQHFAWSCRDMTEDGKLFRTERGEGELRWSRPAYSQKGDLAYLAG